MSETIDRPNVVMHPPIAWALAFVVGLGVGWLYPLRFLPTSVPRAWLGGGVFAVGLVLAIWAIATMRKAGTRVETNKPTTTIVANGPYGVTRNPIYIGMFLGQTGLAIGFDNPVDTRHSGTILSGHPLRRDRPRRSLSGTQVRCRLSRL